jgi:nuclear cap-binding protein subunit 1
MVPIEGLIHSYVGDEDAKPMGYHSVIGLLQAQLSTEAENGFVLACLPRFEADALSRTAEKTEDESMPTAPQAHAFPTFNIPSPVNPGSRPVFPEAYFSLFADQDGATVPKTSDVASSLIRDAIVDTINQLDFNRDMVAKFLVDLDCYFHPTTFATNSSTSQKTWSSMPSSRSFSSSPVPNTNWSTTIRSSRNAARLLLLLLLRH